MKWFANDSDADRDPKIQALILKYRARGEELARRLNEPALAYLIPNAAIGTLWRTWCFVARHGEATWPNGAPRVGYSLDSSGRPIALPLIAENAGVPLDFFVEVFDFLSLEGHIDRAQWRKKIIYLPAMAKRADEYTKKLLAKAQQDSGGPAPDDVPTLSEDPPSTSTSTSTGTNTKIKGRSPRSSDADPSPLFSAFWLVWPHKVAKAAAIKAWLKLGIEDRLDREIVVQEEIIPAVQRQTEAYGWGREDGEYMPNPATWLNARRWHDAIDPARAARRKQLARVQSPKAAGAGATGGPSARKSAAYGDLAIRASES